MKRILINSLMCLNICCGVFVAGCSTPIKQAGKEHATAIGKWNELARYAESQLNDYPVTITAKLALVKNKHRYTYQLGNIQLSKNENSHNINLLAPNFEHKYICRPVCYQLLEYVTDASSHGSTLLNEYFALHEFELFSFYGEIFKMNENLNRLSKVNNQQIINFLDYIRLEKREFEQLSSFASYLSENLSEARYQAFLNDPKAIKIRQKTSQVNDIFTPAIEADADWLDLTTVKDSPKVLLSSPENKLWASNDKPEIKQWEQVVFKPSQLEKTSDSTFVKGPWLMAKNENIALNDYVCSYTDNKFGRVNKMSESSVKVELIGQAKLLHDGILYDLEQGALFNGNSQAITFLPLKGSESFSQFNVASCQPQ